MNTQAGIRVGEAGILSDYLCCTDLERSGHIQEYVRGDYVFMPEDPSNEIFLIREGRVKIGTYHEDGREVLKCVLREGDIFGELALAGEEFRSDFAVALDEKLKVCRITVKRMEEMMNQHRELGVQFTRIMGRKLRRMEKRLEALVFQDARTRIVRFLTDLVSQSGEKVGTEWLVRRFLTHKEISHLTGTSRQTVTSVLNELRSMNIIWFDRKRLIVRDLEALG